eukprot:scaffold307_cov390-Prasinococcus_capsulatus_cf.AAC.24
MKLTKFVLSASVAAYVVGVPQIYAQEEYGDDLGDEYGGDEYDPYGGYGDMDDYGGYGGYGMGGGGGGAPGPEAHIQGMTSRNMFGRPTPLSKDSFPCGVGVLDLDDKTFDKVITGDKHAFVEFYAPWCGHCKEFKSTYEEIAESMGDLPNLILAKVTKEPCVELYTPARPSLVRTQELGFPTMKVFPKGQDPMDYEGDRSADAVIDYLSGIAGGAGTVEALNGPVEAFMNKPSAGAVKQLATAVAGLEGDEAEAGKYYEKVANNVVSKGTEYLDKEIGRLSRMLDSGSVKSEKVAEFKARTNVLKVFAKAKEEL